MAMEKHGVVGDEGDAPAAPKEAAAGCRPGCCAPKSCGDDPLSKMADAAATKAKAAAEGPSPAGG